jgi:hypothetical protein
VDIPVLEFDPAARIYAGEGLGDEFRPVFDTGCEITRVDVVEEFSLVVPGRFDVVD